MMKYINFKKVKLSADSTPGVFGMVRLAAHVARESLK